MNAAILRRVLSLLKCCCHITQMLLCWRLITATLWTCSPHLDKHMTQHLEDTVQKWPFNIHYCVHKSSDQHKQRHNYLYSCLFWCIFVRRALRLWQHWNNSVGLNCSFYSLNANLLRWNQRVSRRASKGFNPVPTCETWTNVLEKLSLSFTCNPDNISLCPVNCPLQFPHQQLLC